MQPTIARVLDIGSGTGNHLRVLNHNKVKVVGIDKSKDMINKSKEKYPDIEVVNNDVLDSTVFERNSFTHIQCLSMTIYYIKHKKALFKN